MRAAARGCGFPDDSGIEEEREPGPAGGEPEQEDRAWILADEVRVYPENWRSTH